MEIEGRMFTCNTVKEAKRNTKKNKAHGPDRVAPIHLHHLARVALRYLTNTLNFSVNSAKIPNIWKIGRVIPLHKPGKPIDESKSFRPMTLLSPIAKLTENY